jgi:hypothetical protein
MNVEDWARPTRGRIVITANPPRRHEEYAIISIDPPPPANQIYEAIDEVLEYFEEEHHVRFGLAARLRWVFVLPNFLRPLLGRP